MTTSVKAPTVAQMKGQARALRAGDSTLTHARALEAVARRHGFKDWNTARARASNQPVCPVDIGERVAGRYLKQPFEGTVIGLLALTRPGTYQVTVQLDDPVDVVTFDSFSNFRHRVTCVVDEHGTALAHTSDGQPHMVLEG